MARTNIDIDDALVEVDMVRYHLKTKREAVELGLRTLLRLKQQAEIKKLRGRITWEGDLDAMRREK